MKKRRGCVKWAVVAVLSLVAVALVVLCPLAFLYTRRLDQARAEYESPTVYITVPTSGVSVPAGSGLLVAATAMGRTPITRIELWAADELVETLGSDDPEGTSNFDASFQLVVPEGANLLYARAINAAGIIGQSMPVSVFGEALQPGDIVTEVTVQEGQSLEEIAGSFEINPQTLYDLNPDLGGQEPAPGSTLTVPAPEREEDDQHVAPPTVGPSVSPPPSGSGTAPIIPPSVPPLSPIQPSPSITGTIPLPIIVGSLLPKLAIPVFTPPAAPTGLQGYVEDCMVYLAWNDNAGDELRYEVWMAPMGGSSQLIASLQPAGGGPAWVKFPAPQTGGLSFWVEAVNFVGKQPSNIVWVEVDPSCPTAAPDRLQLEVVDMTTGGAYDRAYCYVSFENTTEVRMPGDDSDFVQVSGGQANIATWEASNRKFGLPIPGDDSLEVTGECWGWAGQRLIDLGTFSGAYPRETWDGTRRSLTGETYDIGVTVQAIGGTGTRVTYSYRDSTIPAPYALRDQMVGTAPDKHHYPRSWEQWFLNRRLIWAWTGDPQKLTGFTIFLNGARYKSVYGANVRDTTVTLPALYDQRVRWQVAADAGEAQSPLSQELAYDLPKSRAYVQVRFDTIRWLYTCDGCCCGDCSTCEAYGWLSLRMGGHEAFKLCAYLRDTNDVKCGNTYTFADVCEGGFLAGDFPDVLILPFDKESKNLTFNLWVHIYDDDGIGSGSDTIADYKLSHSFSSLQHAQSLLGCGKKFQERDSSEDGSSGISYTLTVYPNSCGQEPTYFAKDWGAHH